MTNESNSKEPTTLSNTKSENNNSNTLTVNNEQLDEAPSSTTTTKRRIIRRRKIDKSTSASTRTRTHSTKNINSIPESILENKALQSAIASSLPSDYDFEIYKTIWRIQQSKAKHVALQMPEGLLMYSCTIADILRSFSSCGDNNNKNEEDALFHLQSVSVLGDVTYGACCVDDLGAKALGADLLVHYGHSCLVPMTSTCIPCLYVFVEIRVDVHHLVECFCQTCPVGTRVHVMGTVQFRMAVAATAKLLNERDRIATVPQAKPLSPGEVLGCTAPTLLDTNTTTEMQQDHVMLFIADGRFHLEAAMIANPTIRALRYDPYSKTLTDERYETDKMKSIRKHAIQQVMSLLSSPPEQKHHLVFGIILGTLGRQGNPSILSRVRSLLQKHHKKYFILLLSEIFPKKLDMFPNVNVWVQIACPRLSIDWGHFFNKPVLSPYELEVALEEVQWKNVYPMDFYASGSGPWTNYNDGNRQRSIRNDY